MEPESSKGYGVLELMLLDKNAVPTPVSLSLLEDITDHFSPAHEIGRGGFAVVYKGIVGEGRVAVKKLTRTHDLPESKFHKEVECLVKAKHKNIVRFLGYCVETQGEIADCDGKFVISDLRNWLLCFEYLPNGSLDKYITDAASGLEWTQRFRIIKGICEGLHYLHTNRILHLDLKPANILLDGHMVPKIADFGLSKCLDEKKTHATTTIHMSGTPGYMAPEILCGGKITFATDIYSLGSIILEILTGVKGYPEDENVTGSWMNRLEGGNQLGQVRLCTKIGIDCMEYEPKKRPVARRIIDLLEKVVGAEETATTNSPAGLQEILFSKEQSLVDSLRHEDIKEHPDTEKDHSEEAEENTDHRSSPEEQVNHSGTSIVSSNSSVLEKLSIFNVFRSDAQRNFVRNRGRILKKVRGLRIFTMKEINKITKNNSELLASDYSSRVYKGILPDSTMVSVRILLFMPLNGMEEFVSGVEIRTQMFHKNIIKLVGCCLEADYPIIVDEYAANGSLEDILHGNRKQNLPIDLRLDIALGSAEGLRHMHSIEIQHGDVLRKIRYGDVQPASILLDEKLTPKISDFGLVKSINGDKSFTDYVVGHKDYMDPVFMYTGLLTQKSDVYSFGGALLELITRKKMVYNENCSLIIEYRKCNEIEKNGRAMFDEDIAAEEDILVLEGIGKLAIECLNEDIEERPDMTEVTEQLVMLRRDRRLGKARYTS